MSLRYLIFFLVYSLVECVCFAAPLKWNGEEIDVAVLIGNDSVDFQFEYSNPTENTVVIEDVISSCDCTKPKVTKSTILPKEVGNITGRYSSKNQGGRFNATIIVKGYQLVDGLRVPFRENLKLNVSIPEVLTIKPGLLLWKKGSEIVTKKTRLLISQPVLMPLRLVEPKADSYQVTLSELELGRTYELQVTPVSTNRIDTYQVILEGSVGNAPPMRFYVHILIR
jgi:hypothetical protein